MVKYAACEHGSKVAEGENCCLVCLAVEVERLWEALNKHIAGHGDGSCKTVSGSISPALNRVDLEAAMRGMCADEEDE